MAATAASTHGGNAEPTCDHAVFDAGSGNACGRGDTTWSVCSKPVGNSPYGACDMAGNVWEWVEEAVGSARVLRGGSWDVYAGGLRASFRFWRDPSYRYVFCGFRCASHQ